MKLIKKALVLLLVVAIGASFSACGIISDHFADPTPQTQPHFIDPAQRDSQAYIPLVEKAKTDSSLYVDIQTTDLEDQIYEFMEILEAGKLPKLDGGAVKTRLKDLWDAVVSVFLDYTHSNMTDFERMHAFNDYLAYFIEYDFDSYQTALQNPSFTPTNPHIFDMTGALIEKVAVCEGISQAFSILCSLSNIENVLIFGESSGIPHAWNKVKLEGDWYNVDPTAAMQYFSIDGKRAKQIAHGFMLISDEEITAEGTGNHTFYGEAYNPNNPECVLNYQVFSHIVAYRLGFYDNYARLTSKQALMDVFSFVKNSNRTVGKVEVQLAYESEESALKDIEAAYNSIKDSSFRVSDKPWKQMPNNVYLFLIYK